MARPGITKKEVFSAANELVGQGIEPTIDQVRGILRTGSNSTIAGFLREWRSLRVKTEGVPLQDDLPAEITGLMKGLWQRLLQQSHLKIEAIEQESRQAIESVKSELAQLQREHNLLQQQGEQQKKDRSLLLADKIALEEVVKKQNEEIIGLHSKQEGLLVQLEEKENHANEMKRLHRQVQENLEHFRESARVQYVTEQEKHAQQLQQVEWTLKKVEEQLRAYMNEKQVLQLQLEKTSQENKSLEKMYGDMIDKFNTLSEAYKAQEKMQERKERDIEYWQHQVNVILKTLEETKKITLELEKKKAVLEEQLLSSNKIVSEFEAQNKLLALEKWELVQEKTRLEGENRQIQKMLAVRSTA